MSTTGVIVGGLVSFVCGVTVGRWWGRHVHKNSLVADTAEANEMRSEAAASIAARTQRRLDKVMALAEQQGQIVNDDVEDLFCISNRTATVYLSRLVRLGKLRRQGAGRGTYYTVR